jgi:hypothetical protein
MYGHDWRVTPPNAWLALLAEREVGVAPTAAPTFAEPLLVLSESDFAEAVWNALRDWTRPDVLAGNPLTRSRLVVAHSGPTAPPAARAQILQALIKSAAESMQASARDRKFYRTLYHTYLQPAATQEQAAELLDLPFSTFRRHLKSGLTRLTGILWAQEVNG